MCKFKLVVATLLLAFVFIPLSSAYADQDIPLSQEDIKNIKRIMKLAVCHIHQDIFEAACEANGWGDANQCEEEGELVRQECLDGLNSA